MNRDETDDQYVLDAIRRRAAQLGCRIEVCSDPGDMPVSASNNGRNAYGFGKTITEAVDNLTHSPRKIP